MALQIFSAQLDIQILYLWTNLLPKSPQIRYFWTNGLSFWVLVEIESWWDEYRHAPFKAERLVSHPGLN